MGTGIPGNSVLWLVIKDRKSLKVLTPQANGIAMTCLNGAPISRYSRGVVPSIGLLTTYPITAPRTEPYLCYQNLLADKGRTFLLLY